MSFYANKVCIQKEKETSSFNFEQLPSEKIAWLAGLLQAEAYFYQDKRVRAKADLSEYTPPPGIPIIKLEMIEEDLMGEVASLVDEKCIPQKRNTVAGKAVYRVTIQARAKVEALLKSILPYVVGKKTRSKIEELLQVCESYKVWKELGGRSQAAKHAARAKVNKNKEK